MRTFTTSVDMGHSMGCDEKGSWTLGGWVKVSQEPHKTVIDGLTNYRIVRHLIPEWLASKYELIPPKPAHLRYKRNEQRRTGYCNFKPEVASLVERAAHLARINFPMIELKSLAKILKVIEVSDVSLV